MKKIISTAALALLLSAGVAAAQTTTDATVGTPNTGAGGMAALNLVILGTSAAVAIGAATLLAKRREV